MRISRLSSCRGKGRFLSGFEQTFFGNGLPDEPEYCHDERLNDPENDQPQGAGACFPEFPDEFCQKCGGYQQEFLFHRGFLPGKNPEKLIIRLF